MRSVFKALIVTTVALMLAVAIAASWFFSLQLSPTFAPLPSVTTTSIGQLGDPINIAFIGDEASLEKVFLAAHWLVPDLVNASSTKRIVEASIANAQYPTAPVSKLYLFGHAQDIAYEFPTNTVRNRHHVRLWKTNETVSGKSLWIGAASYDSGIEVSGVTYLPTHHISPNVNGERDFVARSLSGTDMVESTSMERNARPTAWGFNGGGDWYFDDGLVSVLTAK